LRAQALCVNVNIGRGDDLGDQVAKLTSRPLPTAQLSTARITAMAGKKKAKKKKAAKKKSS
jgi:hypothetical protein